MFKKIFEYAGPYKKNMYAATVVVLVSVLMGVLPFVLAYQVISPLVMGDSVETGFVLLRVIGVLICLILQAVLYGWGLSISHKAAYNTLLRLRVSLQKKFEKLPLGIVEQEQSKSCLLMMWTAWNCSLRILSLRASQIY